MFVDTHAHLSAPDFDPDREAVLAAALEEGGMPFMVNVGYDRTTTEGAVALAESDPRLYASVGVHPHQAAEYGVEGARELIAGFADHPRVVALGEMGLDFYYDNSPRDVQREVFRAQLAEGAARDMPVILHVRDAEDEALEILAAAGWPAGIWHCFSGTRAHAEAAVARGLYVSFSGILTFPRSRELREVAAAIPADRILVETDCPYLAPVPHRGKRNQPAWVEHVGRIVAEVRGEEPEAMARTLTANSRRAFRLDVGEGA